MRFYWVLQVRFASVGLHLRCDVHACACQRSLCLVLYACTLHYILVPQGTAARCQVACATSRRVWCEACMGCWLRAGDVVLGMCGREWLLFATRCCLPYSCLLDRHTRTHDPAGCIDTKSWMQSSVVSSHTSTLTTCRGGWALVLLCCCDGRQGGGLSCTLYRSIGLWVKSLLTQ